jgi:hypothetical protein
MEAPLDLGQLRKRREQRLGEAQSDPSRAVDELHGGYMDFGRADLRIADHAVPWELEPGYTKTGHL